MTTTLLTSPANGSEQRTADTCRDLLARFAATGDESAFAELVRRHGPMVLGVCRRTLGNQHDAEDAFQATWAVFVRRAASIRHPERLAGWLYGVAQRTSLKLRGMRLRREEVERQVSPIPPPVPPLECAWQEVQQILDEEIRRLDAPLRDVIVLCYLEGKTQEDAARELGRPTGSMSWLAGRALSALRERLAGRGLTLTGGMSSLLLALNGSFPVSEEMVLAVVRSAGAAGTAAPLAWLVEAVVNEQNAERTSQAGPAVALALIALFGAGVVGYKALASGPPPSPEAGTPAAACGTSPR